MTRRIGQFMVTILVVFMSFTYAPGIQAADANIRVSVSDDPVRINGQLIDNTRTKYPFVTYKGITYMPLTWDNTSALGIGLAWDESAGLQVFPASVTRFGNSIGWKKPSFKQELSANRKLPASYMAAKADYPIYIGSSAIDNSKEQYPFLELQDITYMPLTWQFVHDLLRLTIFWDAKNGLNVIGGQQQVLGRILYDDADYLYISASIITASDQGGVLKVSKTLAEKPVWMNKAEAGKLQEQMEQQRQADPYRGTAVEVETREDGLYYEGIKLLEKAEMVSNTSMSIDFSGTMFKLDGNRSLLAIQKRNSYLTVSINTGYLYMYSDGKAELLKEFPQVPAKVIPNRDGSYWIASNGQSVRGHVWLDTLRLAHLDADGNLQMMNQRWNQLSVTMLGLGSRDFIWLGEPGTTNPQTVDGRIFVQLGDFPLDRERERVELGIYSVDSELNLTRLSGPLPTTAQAYVSSDKQLYTLGERVNTIINISSGQANMWYDHEMLETE
ncbi:hypothetical protein FE783_04970 [Paenibacillus mesophilus]|uniref:hypothetical protein n=1 Tax=Paenibacillus mesophilus TaxID=2582849 RepID=UPI00110D869A|nr:hypothetical protein [Paenibacillus mesophilus]TMV52295.1 hypothetical protein FE783_04970 [Paenibacillus mesophilus]